MLQQQQSRLSQITQPQKQLNMPSFDNMVDKTANQLILKQQTQQSIKLNIPSHLQSQTPQYLERAKPGDGGQSTYQALTTMNNHANHLSLNNDYFVNSTLKEKPVAGSNRASSIQTKNYTVMGSGGQYLNAKNSEGLKIPGDFLSNYNNVQMKYSAQGSVNNENLDTFGTYIPSAGGVRKQYLNGRTYANNASAGPYVPYDSANRMYSRTNVSQQPHAKGFGPNLQLEPAGNPLSLNGNGFNAHARDEYHFNKPMQTQPTQTQPTQQYNVNNKPPIYQPSPYSNSLAPQFAMGGFQPAYQLSGTKPAANNIYNFSNLAAYNRNY